MERRRTFTQQEAEKIRYFLQEKIRSGNLKRWRDKLRGLGFFISDFASTKPGGFSVDDFDQLVRDGRVTIESP